MGYLHILRRVWNAANNLRDTFEQSLRSAEPQLPYEQQREQRKAYTGMGLQSLLRKLRNEDPEKYGFIDLVSSSAFNDVCNQVDKAWQRHLFRNSSGGRFGKPKYKSFRYVDDLPALKILTKLTVRNGSVRVPEPSSSRTLGGLFVKLQEKDYLLDGEYDLSKVKGSDENGGCATVTYRRGRWYLSVSFPSVAIEISPDKSGELLIHFGLRKFMTLSNGWEPEIPLEISDFEKKQIRLQRRLSRKEEAFKLRKKEHGVKRRSNNYLKDREKYNNFYATIVSKREDFAQKISTEIIRLNPQVIVIDGYDISQMVASNSKKGIDLNRRVLNVAWGRIRQCLRYKASWNMIRFVESPEGFPTSKRCSCCGEVNESFGVEIVFTCPTCSYSADREENALNNLRWLLTDDGQNYIANSTPNSGGTATTNTRGKRLRSRKTTPASIEVERTQEV